MNTLFYRDIWRYIVKNRKTIYMIFILITSIITAYYGIRISILRILNFHKGHDTVIFAQKLWNTLHGKFWYSMELGDALPPKFHHPDFTLLILLPFFAIFPSVYTLAIAQAIFTILAGIIIYLILEKKDEDLALLLSLGFILHPVILLFSSTGDFATTTLSPFFYFIFVYAFLKDRKIIGTITLILSFLVNNEAVPYTTLLLFLTIYLLSVIKDKRILSYLKKKLTYYSIITIIYIVIVHFIIFPIITFGNNVFTFYYNHRISSGHSISDIIYNLLFRNWNLKRDYLINNLLPFFPFSILPQSWFIHGMNLAAENIIHLFVVSHYTIPTIEATVALIIILYYYKIVNRKTVLLSALITIVSDVFLTVPQFAKIYQFESKIFPYYSDKRADLQKIVNMIDFNKTITVSNNPSIYPFFRVEMVYPLSGNIASDCHYKKHPYQALHKYANYILIDKEYFDQFYGRKPNCLEVFIQDLKDQNYTLIYNSSFYYLFYKP